MPAWLTTLRILAFLLSLLFTTAPAWAATQPMALAPQTLEIAAGATGKTGAYCLDHAIPGPTSHDALGLVGGTITVCSRGRCVPLDEAIARTLVRVRGTSGYEVAFDNLTDARLTIEIADTAVVSDGHQPVVPPRRTIPAGRHDGVLQYWIWRDLDQVKDLVEIHIAARGDAFAIVGFDAVHADPAAVVDGVQEEDLGATLAKLALARDVVVAFDTDLAPDKLEAVMQDLRVRSSHDGLVAAVNIGEDAVATLAKLGPVRVDGVRVSSPNDHRVEGTFRFQSANRRGRVDGRAVVVLSKPEPPRTRDRIGHAVATALNDVARRQPDTIIATAMHARDAVRDEVRAVRHTMATSPTDPLAEDTVWVLIGTNSQGYILVRIMLGATSWAA